MADQNCRVTVVGAEKRVDVAVPARAAIGEYVGSLALLCGEQEQDTLPAAWSLATAQRGTLPPTASLTDSGIVDGQVLYLRDLTEGEYDEPGVFEIHELVADAAGRSGGPAWDGRARTVAVLLAGVAWLVAMVITAMLAGSRAGAPAGPLAAGAGLILATAAWTARGSRLTVPAAVRVLLALGALPCLGVAGWFVGLSRSGSQPGLAVGGLAAGVLAGALMALVARPAVATFAAAAAAAAAAAVAAALIALHAGLDEAAAVAGLMGYVTVVLAPRAAGRLASAWATVTSQHDTEVTVLRARFLLAGGNVLACVTLAVAAVLLGASPDRYAIGLAVCLSIAVLLHAAACSYTAEAAPAALAGLAGLLTVLLRAPGHLGARAWITPTAGLALGVIMLAFGLALSLRSADRPAREPTWSRVAGGLCFVAAVPLATGVFGVFGQLMHLGQHM